jgi:uncharacterized phage-associated protein
MTSNNYITANDIAPFFIKKGVSPLKLQKLLYYSQVWYFKKTGVKLFTDSIKAWVYGPVVRDIWNKFRFVKRNDLIAQLSHFYPQQTFLPQDIVDHLNDVWQSYGHLSGSNLVDLTHGETPWKSSRLGLLDNQPSDKDVIIDACTTNDYKLDHLGRIPIIKSSDTLGLFHS